MNTAKESTTRDEAITAMAHKIWEEEGRPDGQADAHWARAMAIVDAAPKSKTAPKTKVPAKKK